MASGEMFRSSPTSASTGVAPVSRIAFTVAQNVSGVVITSSPGPMPSAASATCIAALPEFTPSACCAPVYSRNAFSNAAVRGPVVVQPDRSASATAAISASP